MENSARGFRQLGVWQKAYEMTLEIYRLTKKFPKSETYGLTSQLQRAAVLILLKAMKEIIEKSICNFFSSPRVLWEKWKRC